jgi:hypothetical protein
MSESVFGNVAAILDYNTSNVGLRGAIGGISVDVRFNSFETPAELRNYGNYGDTPFNRTIFYNYIPELR